MSKDRVERIWRREGLKVPQRQKPRGRLWLNDGSCGYGRSQMLKNGSLATRGTAGGRCVVLAWANRDRYQQGCNSIKSCWSSYSSCVGRNSISSNTEA